MFVSTPRHIGTRDRLGYVSSGSFAGPISLWRLWMNRASISSWPNVLRSPNSLGRLYPPVLCRANRYLVGYGYLHMLSLEVQIMLKSNKKCEILVKSVFASGAIVAYLDLIHAMGLQGRNPSYCLGGEQSDNWHAR